MTLSQISEKNVAMRPQSIVNLVLKFQVARACFHGEAGAWESGKWKKENKE